MSAPAIQQASFLTGRQMVLFVVVGLHALLIGALMTMKMTHDDLPPVHTFKSLSRIDPVLPPPPEDKPRINEVEDTTILRLPQLPAPVVQFPVVERSAPAPDVTPVLDPVAPPGNGGEAQPATTYTELVSRATRSPDEFYPAASVQRQEQGVAIVQVCVAPDGRLEGRPTLQRSSGSRLLDGAALRWAAEALAFTPATRNGAAVSACKGFRVNFSLR